MIKRAFALLRPNAQTPVIHGEVDSITDQKIVFAGSAEDTLESYRNVTVAGKTYVLFPDEHDREPGKGDYISFATRPLGHTDYGSAHALEKNSVRILKTRTPVICIRSGQNLNA